MSKGNEVTKGSESVLPAGGPQCDATAEREGASLGAFLCWAVVFADIGTSVYYTPGILFGQVGVHAAIFVSLTLGVFVLLTLKYREVAVRYPEGGGVVTVASQAIHPLAGLLGGMFILVDYFLTAAISALSGLIYLSVVAPSLKPVILPVTVVALVALALLNLVGISASAEATAVFASLAAVSQLVVVVAVAVHVGPGHLLATIPRAFSGPRLTPVTVLTGYAGAFLAFSGLESIAQLAPAMRQPRRRVAHLAMGAVVATIALTSPLLTLWSTTLLPAGRNDPNQFISLLGGLSAGQWLQTEVAVTAAVLLVFASNTALIGSYHVFLALSRMRFLPAFLERRNRLRHTPHWAIVAAIGIPIVVLLGARGNVGVLGDLYAFGLLGAFSMTCISLDIVRWHERHHDGQVEQRDRGREENERGQSKRDRARQLYMPTRTTFVVGVFTTACVALAWTTNLIAKPLATLFGGGVTLLGLGIAFATYSVRQRRGLPMVFPLLHRRGQPVFFLSRARKARSAAVLAVLPRQSSQAAALVAAAGDAAHGRAIVFLHHGKNVSSRGIPQLFEVVDPYWDDRAAQEALGDIERLAHDQHLDRRYIYLPATREPDAMTQLWAALRPEETLVVADDADLIANIPTSRTYRSGGGSGPVIVHATNEEKRERGS